MTDLVGRGAPDLVRHVVLQALLDHLSTLGSANDAEDHGYADEAERMRSEACDAIRALVSEYPFLSDAVPSLEHELETRHILSFGWAGLHSAVSGTVNDLCEICARLRDREHAYSKYGWPDHDVDLPEEAWRLELVHDLGSEGDRLRQIWRCPLCGTRYLYRTDYEYLVNGTEDETSLTRLSAEQAEALLAGESGASEGV